MFLFTVHPSPTPARRKSPGTTQVFYNVCWMNEWTSEWFLSNCKLLQMLGHILLSVISQNSSRAIDKMSAYWKGASLQRFMSPVSFSLLFRKDQAKNLDIVPRFIRGAHSAVGKNNYMWYISGPSFENFMLGKFYLIYKIFSSLLKRHHFYLMLLSFLKKVLCMSKL